MQKLKLVFLCVSSALFLAASSSFAEDPVEPPFQKDIDAFEKDRVENEIPEGAVLCVGSSSMRMWGDRIERDLAPLTVIPRGFGGSKFSDVLYHFDKLVTAYKPRAILIYEGDNDLGSGMTPKEVLGDFMAFRKRVEELDPDIRIYVIGVKPSISRWHLKKRIAKTNRLIEAACEKDEKLTFIDVAEFLLNDEGEPREQIFLEDNLHLNTVGYHLWAAAIGLEIVPAERKYEEVD
ncbi:GDSL-type esterase/lipase family protein [Pelagicoccus sp. SDUM812002]|uniref:GDSL-type esterase/lipase family protein n=1 Tax=Pelagicoccus sp. SDUM812002 TaxID=3041266 RepID=UPI0028105360|nr:GDSL-type esterase/lipase family protein [Pelagicoccus sp. SDUM812002]MDQ8185725.1 GDSL-type esterase/lipase family protein [Pelagicoccus sp. SDUM812002]